MQAVRAFLRDAYAQHSTDLRRMDLASFLIKPTQRLSRYALLLQVSRFQFI